MNEQFNIKGHVHIEDSNGLVLVDTHNMILNNGRDFIRNIIFSHCLNKNASGNKIETVAFCKYGSVASLSDIYATDKIYLPKDGKVKCDIATDTNTYNILFKFETFKLSEINGQENSAFLQIDSMGLVGTGNVLITRASFDDIIMTQAQSYNITYTLSF